MRILTISDESLAKIRAILIKKFLKDDYIKQNYVLIYDTLYKKQKNQLIAINNEGGYKYLIQTYDYILERYNSTYYKNTDLLERIHNENNSKMNSNIFMLKSLSRDINEFSKKPLFYSDIENKSLETQANEISFYRLNFDEITLLSPVSIPEYEIAFFILLIALIERNSDKIYCFQYDDLLKLQKMVDYWTNSSFNLLNHTLKTFNFAKLYNEKYIYDLDKSHNYIILTLNPPKFNSNKNNLENHVRYYQITSKSIKNIASYDREKFGLIYNHIKNKYYV